MPTLSFVTPEDLRLVAARVEQLELRLTAYVESTNDEVDTKTALQLTGIKSRTTLIEERDRPGSLIRYSKHGRSASYSRKSCIDYKLARRLGQQPASFPPLRLAS